MKTKLNAATSQTKIRPKKEDPIYNKPSIALNVLTSFKKFFLSIYEWVFDFFTDKPEPTKNQIVQTSSEIDAVLVKQQGAIDFLMQRHQAKKNEFDNLRSQMNNIEKKMEIVEDNGLLWSYNDSKKIGIQAEVPTSPEIDAHTGPASSSLRAGG